MRARPEQTYLEHLSDASFLGKLLVLTANVRLGWKGFLGINALVYSSCLSATTTIKSLKTFPPGVNVIKLVYFVADDTAK